jgi:hypothetical protein
VEHPLNIQREDFTLPVCAKNVTDGASSSDSDADRYVTVRNLTRLYFQHGNQNWPTGYFVEHTGLYFRQVANSRRDVPLEMFWTDNLHLPNTLFID